MGRHAIRLAVLGLLSGTCLAMAAEVGVTVPAGEWPAGLAAAQAAEKVEAGAYTIKIGDMTTPAQADEAGRIWFWATHPFKGGQGTLAPAQGGRDRVRLQKADQRIDVLVDGKLFTAMHFKKSEPKVYLYPVIASTGHPVTRDFPMKDTALEKENGRQDHHHHRSLWCAHGDVRTGDFKDKGRDYWAEPKDKSPLPSQVLRKVVAAEGGPVFGRVVAEIDWIAPDGKRDFSETRAYTFVAGDKNQRFIDVTSTFSFPDQDVMFADTKEGGIVSLRLVSTMDEKGITKPEKLAGQMVNAKGGVGAGQCWGKPAEWCDYVGPVMDEKLGKATLGVAVLDHPSNFRHPTTWHIRDYGLYTANPFGLKDFTGDKTKNGSQVFKKGETTSFTYRVIIHQGDTKAAGIAEQFKAFAAGPAGKPACCASPAK